MDNPDLSIPVSCFLQCLAITFFYERFLVEIRHEAFESKSKQCEFGFLHVKLHLASFVFTGVTP